MSAMPMNMLLRTDAVTTKLLRMRALGHYERALIY
jgi:hypothetical protein